MIRKLLLTAALAVSSAASAIPPLPPPQPPQPQPKLILVISIDQFSADLFDEYRSQFTAGLSRLAGGTVFHNGYQSHASTETCPGHSTILTGAHPGRTGIISNAWPNYAASRADKIVYCAEDESATGSSSGHYTVSPLHLRVPTLGDLIKREWPGSLNVAVSGKDRSAIMMGGHVVDQRWYWDGKRLATDLPSVSTPRTIIRLNEAMGPILSRPSVGLEPPPVCQAKSQVYPIQGGGKPVGGGRLARLADDTAGFRASPDSDGTILAAAAGLIQELGLGTRATPDIISIGLSATDYVGHSYGTGGQEMCLQLLELDREIGDFLAQLDRWHLDYTVVLTADHGGLDIPERLRARGVADAAWVDRSLTPKKVGETVSRQTGIAGPILTELGISGDLYLDPHLEGADRKRALEAALAIYRGHPQVHAAFAKDEIAATASPTGDPVGWSIIERVRASFDPERSGDLYIVMKPHITPIIDTSRYVSTHGSPWDYDRRVPILFWRPGMAPANRDDHVETVDIMPTLAAVIGLRLAPGTIDGHCLEAVSSVTCPSR